MLKRLLFAGAVMLIAIQGLYFQWHYHRSAPGLCYVFDARFPRKVLAPAPGYWEEADLSKRTAM
jgi:hypothetical protein